MPGDMKQAVRANVNDFSTLRLTRIGHGAWRDLWDVAITRRAGRSYLDRPCGTLLGVGACPLGLLERGPNFAKGCDIGVEGPGGGFALRRDHRLDPLRDLPAKTARQGKRARQVEAREELVPEYQDELNYEFLRRPCHFSDWGVTRPLIRGP